RDSAALLAKAEQEVFAIAEAGSRGRQDFTPVNRALTEAFEVLQSRYNSGGGVTGLATGYTDFDEMTAGLQPTDLIILAARPAMGLIASIGRVNATRLRTGQLEDEDWSRVTSAIKLLRDARIFIDDTPALSPDVLRSKARRLKREHGLGLIVIDYLQLMQVPGNSENRATEISEISRSLKGLAKELNVPVIALSQLNRSLETRTDKRPVMADLRESGAIEQDADVIVFIYRDEYYN